MDEAYYWCFSQDLDWGFFDHPPMIALMIKLSDIFFGGTLGVRALTVIAIVGSLYLIYELVDWPKDQNWDQSKVFWALAFCLPLFHIYGFITTPDVPLLFFGVLFFHFYKRVLEQENILDYIAWGVCMGLMLQSKYHTALLIIFIFLSHPKLLLQPKTYLAGTIGLLIWAPNIYWQYQNDWASFKYHLSERDGTSYWYHPFEFLGNAILIYNPFLIGFLIRVLRKRWKNTFEKSLYFTLVGFLIFFALQTLRHHVQPQWLVLTYIPFVILLLGNFEERQYKYLKTAFWISVPLLIGVHVFLSFDLLNPDIDIFRKDKMVEKVEKAAEGKPVVFIDSYKEAALYTWYTKGKLTQSYNTAHNRKNQYNIWSKDTILNHQDVFVKGHYSEAIASQKIDGVHGSFQEYLAYNKAIITTEEEVFDTSKNFRIQIENPYSYPLNFSEQDLKIYLILYQGKKFYGEFLARPTPLFTLSGLQKKDIEVKFELPEDLEFDGYGFAIARVPWPPSSVYFRYDR